MESNNLFFIFLTGLTTGGLTCLAIQGSLLTSIIAQQPKKSVIPALVRNSSSYLPILTFLTSKVIFHTLLGFLLGLLGTSIKLSPIHQGYLQILIGIYLFGVAGNLLNLHPFFRYFVLTPPKFILKFARKISKNNLTSEISNLSSSMLLGALTVFLPCATTQATEILALTSQSPIYGASALLFFTLGTIPTFLLFGFALTKSQYIFRVNFSKILGSALILMSIYTINTGVTLTGSVYTLQNFYSVATKRSLDGGTAILDNKSQVATINVANSGYTPQNITLKKDIPVTLNINTDHVENCTRSFTIPSLNIEKLLPETGTTTIVFTPKKEGLIAFACSMGMYTGNFNVVN